MSDRDRFEDLIRWYPATWRARYGEELTTLLHDVHGMTKVPLRERFSLATRGSFERARSSGLVGSGPEGGDRTRAGALLILWGWALFMVAGSIVQKFSEHWEMVTPAIHRSVATGAFGVIQVAGEIGGLLVLVAAAVSIPGLVRLLRAGEWSEIRGPVLRAVLVAGVAGVSTLAVVAWAHSLPQHHLNGGFFFHGAVFILWGLTLVTALALAAAAAVAVAQRINWSPRVLRGLGGLAIVLTILMGGVAAGTIVWWVAMADFAPRFLGNGLLATSNVLPPALLVAVALMIMGLTVAAIGTVRIVQSNVGRRPAA
jgi:hypothetical protein